MSITSGSESIEKQRRKVKNWSPKVHLYASAALMDESSYPMGQK